MKVFESFEEGLEALSPERGNPVSVWSILNSEIVNTQIALSCFFWGGGGRGIGKGVENGAEKAKFDRYPDT
jgi:hypothetical protein